MKSDSQILYNTSELQLKFSDSSRETPTVLQTVYVHFWVSQTKFFVNANISFHRTTIEVLRSCVQIIDSIVNDLGFETTTMS